LLALEEIAREISRAVNLRIDVFGFDSGIGMPEANDYRDLPHVWAKGFCKMDVDRLAARLTIAQLVLLGDVGAYDPGMGIAPGHPADRVHRIRSRLLQLHAARPESL
jgi:hypothetical protein